MLFNSLEFPVFLAIVLRLFYATKGNKARMGVLLASSLFFYGYWKWSYLLLLLASSTLDYLAALGIQKAKSEPKRLAFLSLSLTGNLGILLFYKYGAFLVNPLSSPDSDLPTWLPVVLPVGISFYTFQAIGYVVDVYRKRLPAERSYPTFLLFITFFPQLVAGPIERAPHLLNQLKKYSTVSPGDVREGLFLCARGFARKILLADRLGVYVDAAYNHPESTGIPHLALATVFFGFQIYNDFAGYSDIARGVARFFGVDLMQNFDTPYHSGSLSEFWSRWHISLSGWFRDYVYIPLGGNRGSQSRTAFNLMGVFILSGLWHGANWTFLIWGFWHGAGLLAERFLFPPTGHSRFYRFFILAWVFSGWFFFRVNSISDLVHFSSVISHPSAWSFEGVNLFRSSSELSIAILGILVMVILESRPDWNWRFHSLLTSLRFQTGLLVMVFLVVLWFGHFKGQDFIYFQF